MSLSEMFLARNLNMYHPSNKTLFDKSLFHRYYGTLDISIYEAHCKNSKDSNHSYDVLEELTPIFLALNQSRREKDAEKLRVFIRWPFCFRDQSHVIPV